jgi:pre-rRNA-processing protein TSR1
MQSFSHKPTTSGAKPNKAFKSRHATKGQQKVKGKISTTGGHRTSIKNTLSKPDRKNVAKMIQREKRDAILVANRLFSKVPKIIALVPLCEDTFSSDFLSKSYPEAYVPEELLTTVKKEGQKHAFQFIANKRNLLDILDSVKAADYVCFILSAKEPVDHFGDLCIRSIQAQGVPTVFGLIQVFIFFLMKASGNNLC